MASVMCKTNLSGLHAGDTPVAPGDPYQWQSRGGEHRLDQLVPLLTILGLVAGRVPCPHLSSGVGMLDGGAAFMATAEDLRGHGTRLCFRFSTPTSEDVRERDAGAARPYHLCDVRNESIRSSHWRHASGARALAATSPGRGDRL